ncbi:GR64E protein, partial [Pseudoatta argentina]
MGGTVNVSSAVYGKMLKTNQIFSAGSKISKRSGVTGKKILPYLMRQKKDKAKKMETQFSSNSQPRVPNPPRSRPFLNEQTLSISSNDPESFHCVMEPVLVMAQLFGILPVSGILMPSPLQIEFVKFSVRTIYSAFISGMVLFMATLSIIHMIKTLNSATFEVQDLLKNFDYFKTLEFLFSVKYNLALGIFIFIVSKLATFTWNFTDVFIAMVATGLAERYKTLYKYVISSISKHRLIDWSELREDYAVLSFMVKKVDNDISPIIFLSFVNNLYFICLQLLNGLSLLHLLSTDNITLTGMRFFSITRNFLLAVKTNQDLIKKKFFSFIYNTIVLFKKQNHFTIVISILFHIYRA